MSDEVGTGEDAEGTEATPPLVHDDIMQRLMDYQRRLREGLTPEQAAKSNGTPILVNPASQSPATRATRAETIEVVDLAAVEGPVEEPIEVVKGVEVVLSAEESEPQSTDLAADLAARLARLEDTLSSVAKSIGDLREQFQNMAIAADERLGVIESMISSAKDDLAPAS
jgi:flagellar motor switch protein FliG